MSATIRTGALLSALLVAACNATTGTTVQTTPTTGTPSATAPQGPEQAIGGQPGTVAAGQELDVRLQTSLSSETATVEQRFEATTAADLVQNGRVLIPAGSVVRGVVSGVRPAGRIERAGSLTLSFDQIVVRGREHPIRGTATQVFQSGGIRDEVGTAGAGAGAGAVVGGILGGLRGALIGAVIGAGGVIAATEGSDIELPAGTIVRIRLDTPINLG